MHSCDCSRHINRFCTQDVKIDTVLLTIDALLQIHVIEGKEQRLGTRAAEAAAAARAELAHTRDPAGAADGRNVTDALPGNESGVAASHAGVSVGQSSKPGAGSGTNPGKPGAGSGSNSGNPGA
eukprot:scaffold185474_cov12-Tisochrysis_lutea.AAC.1